MGTLFPLQKWLQAKRDVNQDQSAGSIHPHGCWCSVYRQISVKIMYWPLILSFPLVFWPQVLFYFTLYFCSNNHISSLSTMFIVVEYPLISIEKHSECCIKVWAVGHPPTSQALVGYSKCVYRIYTKANPAPSLLSVTMCICLYLITVLRYDWHLMLPKSWINNVFDTYLYHKVSKYLQKPKNVELSFDWKYEAAILCCGCNLVIFWFWISVKC